MAEVEAEREPWWKDSGRAFAMQQDVYP